MLYLVCLVSNYASPSLCLDPLQAFLSSATYLVPGSIECRPSGVLNVLPNVEVVSFVSLLAFYILNLEIGYKMVSLSIS